MITEQYVKDQIADHEKRHHSQGRFKPPTIAEVVKEFPDIDAQGFIDFYQSKGWMVGKVKMKDWRAAARRAKKWDSKPTEEKKCRKCWNKGPAIHGPDNTGQMYYLCPKHGGNNG